uniref:SEC7 domain-containing protein n=1 Tax=Macrostomum lignano TaxID=282301 RepID=A0A1I8JRL0_9PLAT
LELYLTRLMEIVTSEGNGVSFDHRELALESLVQLWRVPGFVAEVYLNYDCDLYCSTLFKDITELLTGGGIFSTHLLSLDALLTVIDCIEAHCNAAAAVSATKASASQKQPQQQQQQSQQLSLTQASLTTGYQAASAQAVAAAPASTISAMSSAMMSKKHRNPAKGLAFLGEHKLLYPNCPESVAAFLRENPSLDKKVLGEFISKKKAGANSAAPFAAASTSPADGLTRRCAITWRRSACPVRRRSSSMCWSTLPTTGTAPTATPLPNEDAAYVLAYSLILRRGSTEQASFIRAPVGQLDLDLFNLIWGPHRGPRVLSHVFDKTADEAIVVPKAISGFRKCAMISAHYGLTDVFDNIIISLCKFTGLLSSSPDNIAVQFGGNIKAQLAAKTVCGLTHRHGDILREGWKNLLDCMLHLYKARLMPDSLVEVKDFIHPSGKIRLIKEETTNTTNRQETGVFSSLYMSLFSDTSSSRAALSEELAARQRAAECIRECQLEQLVQDTKFLRMDSLSELVKDLIFAVQDNYQSRDLLRAHSYAVLDEDACVFTLNCSCRCCCKNRDRLGPLWSSVRSYFYNVLIGSTESSFLLERSIVGLIRLGHRLLPQGGHVRARCFSCLRLLILAKPSILHSVCRQVVYGLHDLINTHAQSVHSEADWRILFALLEVCGAGALPSLVYRAEVASSLPEGFGPARSAAADWAWRLTWPLATAEHRRPQPTPTDQAAAATPATTPSCTTLTSRVGSGGGSGGDRDVRMDREHGQLGAGGPPTCPASAQDVSGPASSAGSSAGATAAAAATVAAGTGGYERPAIDSSHWFTRRTFGITNTKALVRACETLSFVHPGLGPRHPGQLRVLHPRTGASSSSPRCTAAGAGAAASARSFISEC